MAKRASTRGKSQHQRLLEIASLFEVREKKFDGNGAKLAADQLRAQQQSLHFQFLDEFRVGRAQPASHLADLVSVLRAYVAQSISEDHFEVKTSGADDPTFSLAGDRAPILTDDTIAFVKAIIGNPEPLRLANVYELILAAYIGATTEIGKGQPTTAGIPAAVAYAQIQLQVVMQIRDGAMDVREVANDLLVDLNRSSEFYEKKAQESFHEVLLQRQSVNEEIVSARGDLAMLKVESEDASARVEALKTDFESRFTGAEGRAQAFLESIRARVETKELRKHWDDRARDARRAWVLSGAFLAFLFVVVPIALLYHASDIGKWALRVLEELGTDGASEGALVTINLIGKLFILSAPALLFFWVIRLVVRFNTRSMLLMDDANQRSTILETYYRMTERGESGVEERGLVLQALTRPPPGHGGDSVEPPNFVDAIKALKPS